MSNKHPLERKTAQNLFFEHPIHRAFRDIWGSDLDFFGRDLPTLKAASNVSLSEDENHIYVDAALPGLDENEIEVTLEKGALWIQGNKKEEEEKKKYHYKATRSYSYQLALPESVDENAETKASYEKGVLHITFNKTKGQSAKKICIECCKK